MSAKKVFQPNSFAANSFASGAFRGYRTTPPSGAALGSIARDPGRTSVAVDLGRTSIARDVGRSSGQTGG